MPLPTWQQSVVQNRGTALSGFASSPNIWWDCPIEDIKAGRIAGAWQEISGGDTGGGGGLITSPTGEAALVGYPASGFGSANSTITYLSGVGGGIVLTEATDNEAVGIRKKSCPFLITAAGGKLWFEMRIRQNQGAVAAGTAISDNVQGWIAGLWSDVAMTVDIPLSAANPPIMATTGDFVGFRMPEEDAGGVNFVYDTADADQTTDAEVVVQTGVTTMTNGTFINLGMVFDPQDLTYGLNSGRPTLYSFTNNLINSSYKTIPNATATDFPATKQLGLMAFQKLGASTSTLFTIQWMRCFQLGVAL